MKYIVGAAPPRHACKEISRTNTIVDSISGNHAANLLVGCRRTVIVQMDFLIPRLSTVIVALR